MSNSLKTILAIAGSDPIGGAGLQADIRSGNSLGLHVATAITAVTSQNSSGLFFIDPVDSSMLKSQLDSIIQDFMPDAIKIGMIGSKENFNVISEFLEDIPHYVPVIVDPVMTASANGNSLFEESLDINKIVEFYYKYIFPHTTVITPNIHEISILTNLQLHDEVDFLPLKEILGIKNLVITGSKMFKNEITDILVNDDGINLSSHKEINCKNLHGTGCVYSTLMASYLAMGFLVKEAFEYTSAKLFEIIKKSCGYNLGNSTYGPLNINNYSI